MPQTHLPPPRLTLITDSSRFSGEAFFQNVEQALIGGVDAVLVREKNMTSAKLLALASRLRQMTRAHQARLIIHSQADICDAVDADGVHLASNGINSIPSVRQWFRLQSGQGQQPGQSPDQPSKPFSEETATQATKSISVSCHNADELEAAHSFGADYAMLSPVFPTLSHPGAAHLGLDAFNVLADAAQLPIIALGGISLKNYAALQDRNLAVISALLQSNDPRQTAQQLCNPGTTA
ncbi:MAG: thiamine phosphate synthase [Mariprofundus sp.]|nr:thiamine phosphate synthase [Mariprofundus sp.]